MAELQTAPWLEEPQKAPEAPPSDAGLAPWLQGDAGAPQVSAIEDVAKTAPGAAATGALSLVGMGGDLQQLGKAAAEKSGLTGFLDKHLTPDKEPQGSLPANVPPEWVSKYLPGVARVMRGEPDPHAVKPWATGDVPGTYELPTTAQLKSKVEGVTGPFYKPQTAAGRGTETTLNVLPALAMGGEGIAPTIARAVGSGIGGELAQKAGAAIKPYLPESWQPYVEPVAKTTGIVAGGGIAPRAITPAPMDAERAATVAALRQQAPGITPTAGQQANAPWLLDLEARSPKAANLPAQQGAQFTDAAMRQMGSQGRYNPANLAQGEAVGQEIGQLRNTYGINSSQFPTLLRNIGMERNNLRRIVGPNHLDNINSIQGEVAAGAANAPGQVLNMTGSRYQWFRDQIQHMIDTAPTPTEKQALANVRQHLDTAFENSLPTDALRERARELNNQYTNYNLLRNLPPNANRVVNESISPMDVMKGAATHMGNPAVNADRGTLVPMARNAAKVLTEHPEPGDASALIKALSGMAGGAAGAATAVATGGHATGALSEGLLGSLVGMENFPHYLQMGKNALGRAAMSPTGQAYLRNQIAAPARPDTAPLIRLLLGSAAAQQ